MSEEKPGERPRRRYRPGTGAWILCAVIITLVLMIARPEKFFEVRNVQDGVACTVRHCPNVSDEPDGRVWRRNEEMGH